MIFEIEKDVQRTFPHLHFFQVRRKEKRKLEDESEKMKEGQKERDTD
jgi:hypothetical protein